MLWLILCSMCVGLTPFTKQEYAIQLKPGVDPQDFAIRHGITYVGPVSVLPDYHLFSGGTSKSEDVERSIARHSSELRRRDPGYETPILWMERQTSRRRYSRTAAAAAVPMSPIDPLYAQQWHLREVKVKEGAWDININGRDVTVAIVDDGLQHTHPDFAPRPGEKTRYKAEWSHDYNDGDGDPSPGPGDFHGTSAAGVALATANNTICGCGVAPGANIVGIRLISRGVTDYQEALGLSHEAQGKIDIFSNSWGPADDGTNMEGPGRLVAETFARYATIGRAGKGTIWVWAAGNGGHVGDSCSYDGYAQSAYTIAVGALDDRNKRSYYSEGCPALMCVAPSSGGSSNQGITTVDVEPGGYESGDLCTRRFGGTSSACPLAAGIIALALQTNPNLGWRDVQGLIAKSSTPIDIADAGWSLNSRGYRHNENYGFGLLNVKEIVAAARTWTNFPTRQKGFSSGNIRVTATIPADGAATCVSHRFAHSGITFVEHVLIRVALRHPRRGQLRIRLRSPEEIVSTFADLHDDHHANYPPAGWLFSSVRHHGEATADGAWKLCVEDLVPNDAYGPGILDFIELSVFGH